MGWQKYLQEFDDSILNILMNDRTTGRPLVFPSDLMENRKTPLLEKEELLNRTQKNGMPTEAEEQAAFQKWDRELNRLDEEWFGRENPFSIQTDDGWSARKEKIHFDDPFHWKKYLNLQVYVPHLNCGEALTFSGAENEVPFEERTGALDRTLRLLNENVRSESEWQKRAEAALARILGFEKDPRKLFRARLCILESCREAFENRFGHLPSLKNEKTLAIVIAANFFQTEDEQNTIPFAERKEVQQLSLFESSLLQSEDGQLRELIQTSAADSAPLIQMPIRVYRPISRQLCTLDQLKKSMNRKPENWRILSLSE